MNLRKVADLGQGYEQLSAEEKSILGSQVDIGPGEDQCRTENNGMATAGKDRGPGEVVSGC